MKRIVFFLKETLKALIHHPQNFSAKENLINFPLWWKSLNPSHNSLLDASPWISFTVIKFLDFHLKSDMKIFEYGSGGSTLFFAKRVDKIISIEHNKLWFKKVTAYLQELKLKNIDYKLFEPENDLEFYKKNIADPNDYISDDIESIGKNFKKYVMSINQYPDEYFDVVCIDGRARPSCCKHAISKIKVGGYLIYDNVETTHYENSIALLTPNHWQIDRYYGLFPYLKHFSMTLLAKRIS